MANSRTMPAQCCHLWYCKVRMRRTTARLARRSIRSSRSGRISHGDALANVFGEHSTQTFGRYSVLYISPERVQESKWVRVLIAKDAIGTGWDCPRAEVMVSFRPARDKTHITQLLGRMVRTPLARRIPGNERLTRLIACCRSLTRRRSRTSPRRLCPVGTAAMITRPSSRGPCRHHVKD